MGTGVGNYLPTGGEAHTVESETKRSFQHRFTDGSSNGMLSIETNATGDQKIRIDLEPEGKIWLSANQAGWLHLARICAELGLGAYENGYHFHKDFDFQEGDPGRPEISLGLDDDDPSSA